MYSKCICVVIVCNLRECSLYETVQFVCLVYTMKYAHGSVLLRLLWVIIWRIMYIPEWRTVSALTRGVFLCLFPELRSNEGNMQKNNTRVSTETVRHESTYIISFLTRQNKSINDDKNDVLYTSSPCLTCSIVVLLMTSQSIADDVTITKQLWLDHVKSDI